MGDSEDLIDAIVRWDSWRIRGACARGSRLIVDGKTVMYGAPVVQQQPMKREKLPTDYGVSWSEDEGAREHAQERWFYSRHGGSSHGR